MNNVKEIVCTMLKGMFDSVKGIYWVFTLDSIQAQAQIERLQFQTVNVKHKIGKFARKEEPRITKRVFQCSMLNGVVYGLSLQLFLHVLLPCLEMLQGAVLVFLLGEKYMDSNWQVTRLILKTTFETLWVIPLFLLSRLVNALWFQDIGTLAYKYSIGRPKPTPSLSNFIADNLFSFIIQALFLVQATVVSLFPLPEPLADVSYIFHMCMLYSLYAFEYKWVQMGWPLHQRLQYMESNWPYFLGFGLPLSIITYYPSNFFMSGCAFSVAFPIFIVSANEAEVATVPVMKLPIFRIVVKASNLLFMGSGRRSNVAAGNSSFKSHGQSQQQQQQQSPRHRVTAASNVRRTR